MPLTKTKKQEIEILLASPRGFCAGVERAVKIVELALKKYGAPVYIKHEIVHNKHVVKRLKKMGAIFVKQICDIPKNATTIFSAHGVSNQVINEAKNRKLQIIDATCPLVTKVHNQVQKYEKDNKTIILIGHNGHPEVEGTMGKINTLHKIFLIQKIEDIDKLNLSTEETQNIAYTTQTTLSIDETQDIIQTLKKKYPNIEGPSTNDICYATQNRQNAVKNLAQKTDIIFVVGSKNSSNSNRLCDIVKKLNKPAFLIEDHNSIDLKYFTDTMVRVGITAGASAPEYLVESVIKFFQSKFTVKSIQEDILTKENISFKLPLSLS